MHQSIGRKNKIIIYLIFLFILSTIGGNLKERQNYYYTNIDKINIDGLSNNENSKILSLLDNIFYKNILVIEKKVISKIIAEQNIIEEYSVKKIYPSRLDIKLKSTRLIAKISSTKHLFIGANGKFIINEKKNLTLPYIFGEFDSKEFLKFKKNIDNSKFDFAELKTIYFFPSNRWDILTIDNILIKLPQKDFLLSLNLAHSILSNDQFKNKNLIDLRINKQLILK